MCRASGTAVCVARDYLLGYPALSTTTDTACSPTLFLSAPSPPPLLLSLFPLIRPPPPPPQCVPPCRDKVTGFLSFAEAPPILYQKIELPCCKCETYASTVAYVYPLFLQQ